MGTRAPSPTLRPDAGGERPFRPLLAPPDLGDHASTEARNVLHGRVTAREVLQVGTRDGDLDSSLTRLRTAGSLERIDGTPWALEWAGEASYRAGDGLERTRNLEEVRLEVFQLSVFRRFDDRGFVRLGRFLPRELPAVGFLDGAHGEAALAGERVRLGAVAGLKPTRDSLSPTLDEPTGAGYVTVALGPPGEGARYLGTAGLLGSLYEGKPDRLAVLLDQRLEAGALGVWSSTEVDLGANRDAARDGARLTRWNLLASWDATDALRLGAGLDRFEVPDTRGERDVTDPGFLDEDELFLGTGSWRWFGRAGLRLPWSLALDGEVSFTDEDGAVPDAWRGSLALTRAGLLDAHAASVTLALATLRSDETAGLGGRISAFIPLAGDRLSLTPALSIRWAEHSTAGARFFDPVDGERTLVLDASVRAQWVISRAWSLAGGVSFARTEDDARVLVDVGVTWRW